MRLVTTRTLSLFLCLVLLVSLCPGIASADDASDSALESLIQNAATADEATVWNYYSNANSQQASGNYAEAIQNYAVAVRYFLAHSEDAGNLDNVINGYREIAKCYSFQSAYNLSAAAWYKASYYCGVYYSKFGNDSKVQEEIAYARKGNILAMDIDLYLQSDNSQYTDARVYGVANEPANGTVLGVYAREDPNVSDANLGLYWDKFPEWAGKKHGVYLIYHNYGQDLSVIQTHIQQAIDHDYAIELALQPTGDIHSVTDIDNYVGKLARDMESSGCAFYFRFANEMNDVTSSWYTTADEYIPVFQKVAEVVHANAPSVPVVWSPNDFPPNTIADYYPGDAYVDYVGVSQYMTYLPEIDPLEQGVERRRWVDQLENIYSLYADRKPIMLSEGGCPNTSPEGADISYLTTAWIADFYAYLPMRYPNVKIAVWFDNDHYAEGKKYSYTLTSNAAVSSAYKAAIQSESFLSSYKDTAPVYYKHLTDTSPHVPAQKAALCTYASGIHALRSVTYSINGTPVGTATKAPFSVDMDFSGYAGQSISVTAECVYDDQSTGQRTQTLVVDGTGAASSDTVAGFEDVHTGDYFAAAVQWAYDRAITTGTSTNAFSPAGTVTRGQAVTFLWRAMGSPTPVTQDNPFVDIPSDQYYYSAVLWAYENGITNGTSDTTFSPGDSVTRGQLITFLWRSQGKPDDTGTTQPFYADALQWANSHAILDGTGTEFVPGDPCPRADVVYYLYNTLNK